MYEHGKEISLKEPKSDTKGPFDLEPAEVAAVSVNMDGGYAHPGAEDDGILIGV